MEVVGVTGPYISGYNVLSKLVGNPRAEETQTGFNNVNGVID